MLDGSPVLDIKPSVPTDDVWRVERIGRLTDLVQGAATCTADERFHTP